MQTFDAISHLDKTVGRIESGVLHGHWQPLL
jgi:hypothetical protein